MSILENIKKDLLHIIESMYAITNIDITIVDDKLNRVVATQLLKEKMGGHAPMHSAFHQCILTGEQYFIENPKIDPICSNCEDVNTCNELTELCIPIKFNSKIIGVLGMCAYNEKAKRNLVVNRDSYINFEYQLSNMISTILYEKQNAKLLEYRSSELTTVINSLNEGIAILDNQERIVTMNSYVNKHLNFMSTEAKLKNILPKRHYEQLLKKGFEGQIGPIKIQDKEFVINASPIYIKNKKEGMVMVFSDFEKMKESVFKSRENRDIITFDDIVGESEKLVHARQQAMEISNSLVTVLLLGETGTGKDLFARAIHNRSHRNKEIFMPVNCGAIPENLIESELFGYEKGTFTGANQSGKTGKFEISKDGTVFLDEVGDLPYHMQVKLNHVLESKKIMRVGGYKEIDVNPRIIAATHKDLKSMVLDNTFREDLYYRIHVVPIYIPPLRERGYDIIILARHFLNKLSKLYNKNLEGFTGECEKLLLNYPWPGNIRELKNIIEYGIIFEENSHIGVNTIKDKLGMDEVQPETQKLSELTKRYEKTVIEDRLRNLDDSLETKKKVAKDLGIGLATLYRKLEN